MAVKMIVTDLDKTLLRSDKSVSAYTASILNECRKNGVLVAFATARPERATIKFQSVFMPDYIIGNNGATISHGGELIREINIPAVVCDGMIRAFLAEGVANYITAEAGGYCYTNFDAPPWETEEFGWNLKYTNFKEGFLFDAPKISVECESKEALQGILARYPGVRAYYNSGESWNQITASDASKANAVSYIAGLNDINAPEIAAFGDDFNDLEMLEYSGFGVAVENAADEVKAAAGYICESNDNDGVARWIEKVL